ncbi:hypothetical protein CYMTET_4983 [Cymbomonas tetramitiformis]|uniref:Uncharacterized protein n=1 Tax=Cymbomonas tetramitiformis TaxID=36881 RepID=A0AAE0LJY0_9CHLO|nr:hypothetical protein CYMTET_4983 [Cymbomonas tetramitiformis]
MMKYLRIGFKMGLSPRNVDDPLPQHTPPPPESASYHMQGTDQPFEVSDSRMAEALGIPSSPSPPCPQSPSMWGDSPRGSSLAVPFSCWGVCVELKSRANWEKIRMRGRFRHRQSRDVKQAFNPLVALTL